MSARPRAGAAVAVLWLGALAAGFWHMNATARAEVIGRQAPAEEFTTSGGEQTRLWEPGTPGSLVHVWRADCPYAAAKEPLWRELAAKAAARGIRVVGVRVGRGSRPLPTAGPYAALVEDRDGQIARRLGVERSPSACLIDGQGTLRYVGGYEGPPSCGRPLPNPVAAALAALRDGAPPIGAPAPINTCSLAGL